MWTLSGFGDEISPELDEQLAVLVGLGVRHLEFRAAWGTGILDLDDEQVARARHALAEHSVAVSSISSPIGKIPITEDFDPQLQRFRRAVELAEIFGAPYIRLFSFFIPAGEDPDSYRDEVLRRMRALTEAARGRPVTLLHENEKEIYGDIPRRCVDVVESLGAENLKLIWDPANYVQCGVHPYHEGYAAIRPYLAYVHVKDALFSDGSVVPTGQGDGDISETLDALFTDGFDGFFSLEPHLAQTGRFGGFSGAQLFGTATTTFVELLDEKGIPYR